jgi:hypothetical protein
MTKMAGAITMAIVDEYGPGEMLRRLSDPWWFQAFGSVLGFDWHSSGVTTVTCGAMKEAAGIMGDDLGILVAGGKGSVSRQTPIEISSAADRLGISKAAQLIDCSRTSAKVDSAAVQDGFTLYHHSFFFTPEGQWCVVQQGMNDKERSARRYHWLSESVNDFVCEPHSAISDLLESTKVDRRHRRIQLAQAGDLFAGEMDADGGPESANVLNMVAREAAENRSAAVKLVQEPPDRILHEIQQMTEGPSLFAPRQHSVLPRNVNPARLKQLIPLLHDQMPQDYRQLLGLEGVGPAAVRSLALVAEIIFQAPVSNRDPAATPSPQIPASDQYIENVSPESVATRCWADYSFAHGGKDGTPFPVDCESYDRNIEILGSAIRRARLGDNDRFHALRTLGNLSADVHR